MALEAPISDCAKVALFEGGLILDDISPRIGRKLADFTSSRKKLLFQEPISSDHVIQHTCLAWIGPHLELVAPVFSTRGFLLRFRKNISSFVRVLFNSLYYSRVLRRFSSIIAKVSHGGKFVTLESIIIDHSNHQSLRIEISNQSSKIQIPNK